MGVLGPVLELGVDFEKLVWVQLMFGDHQQQHGLHIWEIRGEGPPRMIGDHGGPHQFLRGCKDLEAISGCLGCSRAQQWVPEGLGSERGWRGCRG